MRVRDDDDTAWLHKSYIDLRTGWQWGAAFCGYGGDPYYRSQRFFIVALQILLSMMLNVLFFVESPADPAPRSCETTCTNLTSSASWARPAPSSFPSFFLTRITACGPYRVGTSPYFVPG